jgi:hypothetical protein
MPTLNRFASLRVLMTAACATILLQSPQSWGWGSEGHEYINQVGAQKIPDSMPVSLCQAKERLVYLATEPDQWRDEGGYSLKNDEWPNHFIDLDRLDGLSALPESQYEFYKLLHDKSVFMSGTDGNKNLPENVGFSPTSR